MAARPRPARRVARALHRRRDVLDSAGGESRGPAHHLVDRVRRPSVAGDPRPSVPASARPRAGARCSHRASRRQRPGHGHCGSRGPGQLDARPARVPPRAPACLGRAGGAPPAPHRGRLADRGQASRSPQFGSRAGRRRLSVLMGGPDMAPHPPQHSEAPRQSYGAPRYPHRLLPPWFFLVTLALWQIASRLDHPDFVLSPVEIVSHFTEALRSGELIPHVGASLVRSLPGFVIGSLVGVILGLTAGGARGPGPPLSPIVFLTSPRPKSVFPPIVSRLGAIGDISQ